MKFIHVNDLIDEFLKYIKNNPLKHRRLHDHLKSSEASHKEFIYNHHIRWLRKSKSYKRIYDIHKHILEFLETDLNNTLFRNIVSFKIPINYTYGKSIYCN